MVALRHDDDDDERGERPEHGRRPRPLLAFVRCDTLPEEVEYRDTGCELSESCLRCPLPRCKYDVPRSARRLGNYGRDREIVLLREKYDAPVEAIAATYGISRRQVFRILKQERVAG